MMFSKLCSQIKPYVAGEQPQDKKYIKLNTNENPYPPSFKVKEVLNGFDIDKLRRYSDPDNKRLKNALAERESVKADNIFVGNGSDEVLALCFPCFFDKGDKVTFADITYSFYKVYANLFEVKTDVIPLLQDYQYDVDKYCNRKSKGIIIANPNAPTGIALNKAEIERIVVTNKEKIIVLDEAYMDFCMDSCVDLTQKYDNVLVVKTFSKSYSLAGARCGYAVGNSAIITALNKIKNSFNSYTVNAMTENVALASLEDKDYFITNINKINNTRKLFIEDLKDIGFNVLPSKANFVFASHSDISAKDLYVTLKERGILVRYFASERIDNFLRITIGTVEEMKKIVIVLEEIISNLKM